MADASKWEIDRQAKVFDMLKLMREEQVLLKESVVSSTSIEVTHSLVKDSASIFLTRLESLTEEFNYLIELSNCKQIMLTENISFLKKLEEEIAELKLRKP